MGRGIKQFFSIALLSIFLLGCANEKPAPIVNGWRQPAGRHSAYTVQRGDTLYSIAWAFDMDFRDLAHLNKLTPPYHLQAGQRLRMGTGIQVWPHTKKVLVSKKIGPAKTNPIKPHPISQVPSSAIMPLASAPGKWQWPTQGKVVKKFSLASGGNKGIEITGRLGQPVVASAFGKVVYSGSGLRGYGKLIIIKHNDTFLSAYAYNQQLLVKENMNVKAGQTIALMGRNNAGQVMLHFEIRRNGKPVNPLLFLRSSNNVLKE